jgi:methyl-accepting chemotaxis protein
VHDWIGCCRTFEVFEANGRSIKAAERNSSKGYFIFMHLSIAAKARSGCAIILVFLLVSAFLVYSNAGRFALGALLLAAALTVAMTILSTRHIVAPISKLTTAAECIARGDVNQTIDHRSNDELGMLADSLRNMAQTARSHAQALDKIADGDVTVQVQVNSDQDALGKSMARMKERLNGLVEIGETLQRANVNDFQTAVKGSYPGIYGTLANATNQVQEHFNDAAQLARVVASGDFKADLERIRKIGKRCQNDTYLPAFITMMEAIESLVSDAMSLSGVYYLCNPVYPGVNIALSIVL